MRKLILAAIITLWGAGSAFAAPVVGAPAPEFTGIDSYGVTHSLSNYKGQTVVLEWTNIECPYVGKHYNSGNMQRLQREARDQGIVWLTIVSSAEGKQGYTTAEEANEYINKNKAQATARILDPSGEIGGLYEAKTTPHMFVIDPSGMLVYEGAIDDDPSFKPENIPSAANYVRAAWEAIGNGQPPEVKTSQPYGCSVKY